MNELKQSCGLSLVGFNNLSIYKKNLARRNYRNMRKHYLWHLSFSGLVHNEENVQKFLQCELDDMHSKIILNAQRNEYPGAMYSHIMRPISIEPAQIELRRLLDTFNNLGMK